jgi:Cu/Zn superoxide dismutase
MPDAPPVSDQIDGLRPTLRARSWRKNETGKRLSRGCGDCLADLPNIHMPSNGQLVVELFVRDITLSPGQRSLLDTDGAALVVHAGEDDYRSEPAGDAGERIACGVIVR